MLLQIQFGYEGYWELVPSGNDCGVGTIFAGGNTNVGCNGSGLQTQIPGGYANSSTTTEGPWCLTEGACFDIKYIDDYNDAGFEFIVKVNGYIIGSFAPSGNGVLTASFCANEPPAIEAGISSVSSPAFYQSEGLTDVSGSISNLGTTTITSLDINYKVDNNTTITMPLNGLNIVNAQTTNFTHPTQWNAPLGQHTIKVWISDINRGNEDANGANDTLSTLINVVPAVSNIIDAYIGVTPIITQIGNAADELDKPTDLDFHPDLTRKELWGGK